MEQDEKLRDAVAREIKKAYVERKSRLLRRTWKPSSRHQAFKLWQNAADQVLELGAPPEAYVYAAFQHCRMSTGPFPNNLGGPAAAAWWRAYVLQNPGYREEFEQLKEAGIEDPLSGSAPAITEIKDDLAHLRKALYKMTGEKDWPPIQPKSLEIVRSEILQMRPHMRLILAYPDDLVREYFGEEIMENFEKRPDIIRAMQTLEYPMNEILAWLRKD